MALGLPYSFHTQLRKLRVRLLSRKIKMEMPSDFPKFTWIEIWRSQDSNLSFFYANLQLFPLTRCCLQLSRDLCLKINVHTHQLENLSNCRLRYSRCEEGPEILHFEQAPGCCRRCCSVHHTWSGHNVGHHSVWIETFKEMRAGHELQ